MNAEPKIWFITGTSSGFGKHLVELVLARGDRVIATVRRLEDFTVTDVDRSKLHVMVLDVTDSEENILKKAQEAIEIWGHVDVLVNNAGNGLPCTLEEGGSKAAIAQFTVNLFGLMNVTNAFLPHMRERRTGTIVQMGSRTVWNASVPLLGFYGASKAAVHAYSETLAAEVRQFGIRVLLVAPGSFRTANVYTKPYPVQTIPAYDPLRVRVIEMFKSLPSLFKGDPAKGMSVLVDVVRGEGTAEGKEFPFYLCLGDATYVAVQQQFDTLTKTMSVWEDVARHLEFDEA